MITADYIWLQLLVLITCIISLHESCSFNLKNKLASDSLILPRLRISRTRSTERCSMVRRGLGPAAAWLTDRHSAIDRTNHSAKVQWPPASCAKADLDHGTANVRTKTADNSRGKRNIHPRTSILKRL